LKEKKGEKKKKKKREGEVNELAMPSAQTCHLCTEGKGKEGKGKRGTALFVHGAVQSFHFPSDAGGRGGGEKGEREKKGNSGVYVTAGRRRFPN